MTELLGTGPPSKFISFLDTLYIATINLYLFLIDWDRRRRKRTIGRLLAYPSRAPPNCVKEACEEHTLDKLSIVAKVYGMMLWELQWTAEGAISSKYWALGTPLKCRALVGLFVQYKKY